MKSISPIVAGIDFSSPSAAVLRHAVHAANLRGAPVIAVHVLDRGILSHRATRSGPSHGVERFTARAERKLSELAAELAADANVRIEVRCGRPADEMSRLIEETGAGLLVIAANDLTKKRLGSIASRCVRTAPCDVLVLRDWQDGNFSKIAACTDFSPAAARALDRGIDLASSHAAALQIIHVMYPPEQDTWGEILDHESDAPTSYAEECHEHAGDAMAAFLSPFKSRLDSIRHEVVILESVIPSLALTHHVQDSGADLVILGTRGMSPIASHFLGTNAERLLHDAGVSVLAVRI